MCDKIPINRHKLNTLDYRGCEDTIDIALEFPSIVNIQKQVKNDKWDTNDRASIYVS